MRKKVVWFMCALLSTMLLCGCQNKIEEATGEIVARTADLIFSSGSENYADSGKVTARIVTPTPIATPTPVPSPTPIPQNGRWPGQPEDDEEPDREDVDEWVYSLTSVNVRSGWSTRFSKVGELSENEKIHRTAVFSNGWSEVAYNNGYAYIKSEYLSKNTPARIGATHLDLELYEKEAIEAGDDFHLIRMKNILQKPELKSGPEITCLATVLNFYEIETDKVELYKKYLPCVQPGAASPKDAYVGNPETSGYGCYAPVIVKAATGYLIDKRTIMSIDDITGSNLDELLSYVDNGIPVMVWCTTNMVSSYVSASWNVSGSLVEWRSPEHCVVLMGYNRSKEEVIVGDPLRGIVTYNIDTFYRRYQEEHENAVVIWKEESTAVNE